MLILLLRLEKDLFIAGYDPPPSTYHYPPCKSCGAVHAAFTLSVTSEQHMKIRQKMHGFGVQSLMIDHDQ